MNRRKWIWLSVILIVVVLIGSIVIKHWNSIEALVDSFRYSQDEVVNKLGENKEQLQKYIDENESVTVRDLTEEEAESLQKGELTEEEAVKVLTGQQPEKDPPEEAHPPKDETVQPEKTEPEEKPASTVISEAIAKLYIQKSIYLGKLDAIESKVYNEFYSIVIANKLNEEEMRAEKQRFLKENISTVAAWENECDNVVYGILDEIKTALKESNEDTDIVKKLEEAYLNEKRLKKSYFINRYMD